MSGKVTPSWIRLKAELKRSSRVTFFQNYRSIKGRTSKYLTIKTNVCPVWGIKARAAMRAQEQKQ